MKRLLTAITAALASASIALGETFIVKDGQPLAEITVAEEPPRTTRLAARELQAYVGKISGAELEIGTAPSGEFPVKIYVGESPGTRRLNITAEGLAFGAYRIVAGEDWLVLLGDDTDWTPPEPWARSHSHWRKRKIHEWDQLTGAKWSNPLAAGMYRHYSGNAWHFGTEDQEADGEIHFWEYDGRGSLNAVYAQRLALVDDYLEELRKRRDQLNQPRDGVPEFRAYNLTNDKWRDAKAKFRLDGKLDERFWVLQRGLKELLTGRTPAFGTAFQVLWDRDAVYFGIRCEDLADTPANVSTTESGKPAIWNGDHVEILIETDAHAYYQIVINPAGAVLGLDRGAPKRQWFSWSPEAEAGAHIGEDFWSVEVRIPVTQSTDDPLHLVVGRQPRSDLPWYFNVCRKRIRETGTEVSAFSPTGANTFHDVRKFGKLYTK